MTLEFNGQLAVERYRESHPSYWQQGGAATGAPWCAGFALTYNPATVASNASVNTQSSLLGEQGVTYCERQHPA
ncbi:hypothetical protein [Massilia sp. Root418]|uniref:hypothetical protein n=1 Tax=Massilia sp. Root418 TaxID=1736532 RepID=UPI000ADC06B6|nr:hypothetical protein [Massilia sp. Root418]